MSRSSRSKRAPSLEGLASSAGAARAAAAAEVAAAVPASERAESAARARAADPLPVSRSPALTRARKAKYQGTSQSSKQIKGGNMTSKHDDLDKTGAASKPSVARSHGCRCVSACVHACVCVRTCVHVRVCVLEHIDCAAAASPRMNRQGSYKSGTAAVHAVATRGFEVRTSLEATTG